MAQKRLRTASISTSAKFPRKGAGHLDCHGQPDSDYRRNRIARLSFELKTGEAQIEK
jgi:hypothetical protein